MDGYLDTAGIERLGLKSVGENVLISEKACIYMPEKISIGSNVRIDDFCILVGDISFCQHPWYGWRKCNHEGLYWTWKLRNHICRK